MPELPEVEHVRRTLEPLLVGAEVTRVRLRRRDVLRQRGKVTARDLLLGGRIRELGRHGKDLAIVAEDGRTVGVHLGMSGWLSWIDHDAAARANGQLKTDHVHCLWEVHGRSRRGVLRFRDPRRFGGLWTFASPHAWRERLADRGPDALSIKPAELIKALHDSHRPIKAALLDQSILAGVGNIYADEALFAVCVHPALSAHRFAHAPELVQQFCRNLRRILRRAIIAGGSSVRSYRDVNGDLGEYVRLHQVYGRAGEPCTRCSNELRSIQLAQRTTVFCPQCQRRSRKIK